MSMPASMDALEARPTLRMEWAGTTGVYGSMTWGTVGGVGWTSGQTFLPFDSATPSTGDSPTSYVFEGRTYQALSGDACVVDSGIGGEFYNHRAALFDLLWVGPIITSTSTQTVGSGTLPARDTLGGTNGEGCQLVVWNSTGLPTCTVTYTNSAGTGSRTATMTATASGGPTPLSLAAGDTGVKSVQDVTSTSALAYRLGIIRRHAIIQRPVVPTTGPLGERTTSRMHNLSVIPSGALLFPSYSTQASNSTLERSAFVELAVL